MKDISTVKALKEKDLGIIEKLHQYWDSLIGILATKIRIIVEVIQFICEAASRIFYLDMVTTL